MMKEIDIEMLGKLSPMSGMKAENLHRLIDKFELSRAASGETLFKRGDSQKRTVYVLDGSVELTDGSSVLGTIEGGSADARTPLSPTVPRQHSAVAVDDVTFISIDSDVLDVTLTLDQTGVYEVGDMAAQQADGDDDWMTALLQIKAFQMIPPQNIQSIFMKLQQVNCKAGDIVVKQGAAGDYFYVIRKGRCLVTRETPAGKENIDLAEIRVGDTFGEEALMTDTDRNATVTMLTDGVLMRLAREDFQSLMSEPMLDWLDTDQADEVTSNGGQWLDVRLPGEFKSANKPGAVNLPLYMLRHKLNSLDLQKKYVVCCDTGRRSAAAAFILNQKGFQTAVLRDGLNQEGLS